MITLNGQMYKELVDGLVSILSAQAVQIVLYGFAARGTVDPESDINIGLFIRTLTKRESYYGRQRSGSFRIPLREKADYDDFFLVAKEDALRQFEKAKLVVLAVEQYVSAKQDV